LGSSGSLAWLFKRTGVVVVSGNEFVDAATESAIENGAEDLEEIEDGLVVYCEPGAMVSLRFFFSNSRA